MKHCAQALLLFTLLAAVGGVSGDTGAEWPRVCPSGRFCFQLPPELEFVPQQVIDSVAGHYQSPSLQLDYDLGWYASRFDEFADATIEAVVVDGRAGEVLSTAGVMALRIPVVRDRIRFAMLLRFTGAANPVVAHRIFNSIEFTPQAE